MNEHMIDESTIEEASIDWFKELYYQYKPGGIIAPGSRKLKPAGKEIFLFRALSGKL